MHFEIENMTCGGCVRGVTKAIQSVDPMAKVNADLSTRRVEVITTSPRAPIAAVLADAGFAAS
jgi:copper chaperone